LLPKLFLNRSFLNRFYSLSASKHIVSTSIFFILFFIINYQSYAQKTILWKVYDTINNKESILLGTNHILGNSFVDNIPDIKNYLLKSEVAIFETIEDNTISNKKIMKKRKASYGLKKLLHKKDISYIQSICEFNIYKYKPIELIRLLNQKLITKNCNVISENDSWDSLDDYLIHLARKNKITVKGLDKNMNVLYNEILEKDYAAYNWHYSKKYIEYYLNQLYMQKPNLKICKEIIKYMNFDLKYGLNKECENDIAVKHRNANWMKELPNLLSRKNCFIAVGLMHLYNDCGLIMQLFEKGFIVEPIIMEKQMGTKKVITREMKKL